MINVLERKIEEKKLLFEILLDDNQGDLVLTRIDYDFFERCFNLKKAECSCLR
jgi:hypothetical protein